MTRQGDLEPFRGQKCALVVSQEYTITGYQDGGDKAVSIMQVNGADTLSLGPKEMGTVLGIDFEGLPVPSSVNPDALLDDEVVMPEERARAWNQTHGFLCSSFRLDFREYVEERQKKLYLPGWQAGRIAAAKAYCLKEEFSHNVRYNWAQDKVEYVNKALRGVTTRTTLAMGDLSTAMKCFLAAYIGASLSLLKRGLAGTGTGVPQPPRRSTRRSNQGLLSSEQSSEAVSQLGGPKRASRKPRARGKDGQFLFHTKQPQEAFQNSSGRWIADGEETGRKEEEPQNRKNTVQTEAAQHEDSRNDPHHRCGKQCKLNGGSVHHQSQLESTELKTARDETKAVAVRGMAMADKSLKLAFKLLDHQADAIQLYEQKAGNFRRERMEFEQEKQVFQQEKKKFALELERLGRNG